MPRPESTLSGSTWNRTKHSKSGSLTIPDPRLTTVLLNYPTGRYNYQDETMSFSP